MKKLLLWCFLISLAACNSSIKKSKPIIMVSIQPQCYFTQALAHDYYQVECMIPQGTSPETYDPTPQQLVNLGKSAAYLRIGFIGFERTWMDKLTANAPHLEFFDSAQGINLIMETAKNSAPIDHHMSIIEPHVWCSAQNAKIITENIYHFLTSLDRQHEKAYTARFDSLQKVIAQVDSTISFQLSHKDADRSFAIYHPSLSYFARDYGLTQITIENNGKEPSPSELEKIIDKCKAAHVHVIFIQPEFDHRNAEIIARQIGAKVVSINPLNSHWDKEMIAIAQALNNHNHSNN